MHTASAGPNPRPSIGDAIALSASPSDTGDARPEIDDPVAVVQSLLADPTNLAHVRALTTPDVRYVSLIDDNPELNAVMPWSGPGTGAESIFQAFTLVQQAWEVIAFTPEQMFGTAASFRSGGAWTFQTFPGGDEVAVTKPPR